MLVGDKRRRKTGDGGAGRPHARGASGKVLRASVDEAARFAGACKKGGAGFGDSVASWPVGSLGQWERPWSRSYVAARDRIVKPSRRWLCMVGPKRTTCFVTQIVSRRNVITEKSISDRGCGNRKQGFVRGGASPVPRVHIPNWPKLSKSPRSRGAVPARGPTVFVSLCVVEWRAAPRVNPTRNARDLQRRISITHHFSQDCK